MQEIKDEDQISYIFNEKLDAYENISKLNEIKSHITITSFLNDDEGKRILAKLVRNIKLIKSEYSGNHNKRCRDVNHWINGKIKTYKGEKNGEDISDYAGIVFNDIPWNTAKPKETVCKRKPNVYHHKAEAIMKKLDDYCESRDNLRCDIFKNNEECLRYNRYIKRNREYFSSQLHTICNTYGCKINGYKIDDTCSLDKMDVTFREINCEALYKKEELQKPLSIVKERSSVEIGFFIVVSLILFYFFITFLDKFTPIGNKLRSCGKRKYAIKKNLGRMDEDYYSQYYSDEIPVRSENKPYIIEYARPQNQ
ncbi:VIR protein [Plasmodium vivax]|uniref:VIR protein n=1 Tax=Plasmodium vivax TaxID=5855 RepID=A0A1G4E7Y2_PLAVI|nr:VIR protein [Plasmodium vivax]